MGVTGRHSFCFLLLQREPTRFISSWRELLPPRPSPPPLRVPAAGGSPHPHGGPLRPVLAAAVAFRRVVKGECRLRTLSRAWRGGAAGQGTLPAAARLAQGLFASGDPGPVKVSQVREQPVLRPAEA